MLDSEVNHSDRGSTSQIGGSLTGTRPARRTRIPSAQQVLSVAAPPHVLLLFIICFLMLARFVPMEQTADGILFTIMSLQKLTLYIWCADRYGNLTALLANWIRDPTANQYFQVSVEMVAGLTAPLFYTSLLCRRPGDAWRTTLLSSCLMLLSAPIGTMQQIYMQPTPYSTSLTCAGLGTLLFRTPLDRRSTWLMQTCALLLIVTAYIVNVGLLVFALPLVGLLILLLPSMRMLRLFSLHIGAAAVGLLLQGVFAFEFPTALALHPSTEHLLLYWRSIHAATGRYFFAATMVPAIFLVLILFIRSDRRLLKIVIPALGAIYFVVALSLFTVASSRWVEMNQYNMRYSIPGLLLLMSAGGVSLWFASLAIPPRVVRRQHTHIACAASLLVLAFIRMHNTPVDNGTILLRDEDVLARAVAQQYLVHGLDGIAASGVSNGYWDVWPAVFMVEQYHYDSGSAGSTVFGITDRGQVRHREFAARLAAQGRLRLGCIDLTPSACASSAATLMSLPGLEFNEFSQKVLLPGGRYLEFTEIKTPVLPK